VQISNTFKQLEDVYFSLYLAHLCFSFAILSECREESVGHVFHYNMGVLLLHQLRVLLSLSAINSSQSCTPHLCH
jgi:hypothetical protein